MTSDYSALTLSMQTLSWKHLWRYAYKLIYYGFNALGLILGLPFHTGIYLLT